MARSSRFTDDLDLESDGRRLHALRIAHPLNDSPFHSVVVPIAVIRNGPGPTALLVGGVHGDEFEGPVALRNLLRRLEPERIAGRVIVIPTLNPPASAAGTRLSPLDGRDLNRSFPGDPDGSPTAVIAHYVESALLPSVDLVLDLHSGGRSMRFLPCLWFSAVADRALMARSMEAAAAFGPPIALVADELGAGALSGSAERHGAVYLSSEVAGAAGVDPQALRIVEAGIGRLLAHLGILLASPGPRPAGGEPTRFMHMPTPDHFLTAPEPGLLEPLRELGDTVAPGDTIARLHRLDRPMDEPMDLTCRVGGLLVGRRILATTRPSDLVAVIASDRPGG